MAAESQMIFGKSRDKDISLNIVALLLFLYSSALKHNLLSHTAIWTKIIRIWVYRVDRNIFGPAEPLRYVISRLNQFDRWYIHKRWRSLMASPCSSGGWGDWSHLGIRGDQVSLESNPKPRCQNRNAPMHEASYKPSYIRSLLGNVRVQNFLNPAIFSIPLFDWYFQTEWVL